MKKLVWVLIAILIVGTVMVLNGNDSSEDLNQEAAETSIRVGMSGSYKPYTYLDENGVLTGFDVEVWKEIGSRIDQDVEFVTSDFSGLFGMLDVGQLDTIANQITVTEARLEKYLFSDPYVYYGAQLIAKNDRDDIVDLASLKGMKVGVSLGSNYEEMVREFDKDGEIEVVTYDSGAGAIQDVAIGRIDAVLNDKLALLTTIQESGLPLMLAGEPVEELFNAFPFVRSEENEVLSEKVNRAIREMYADGTMKELSVKYFNIDITEK